MGSVIYAYILKGKKATPLSWNSRLYPSFLVNIQKSTPFSLMAEWKSLVWIYHILSKHHTPFKPQQSLKFTLQIYSQIHSNIISRILTAELFVTYKTQKWPRCVLIKWLNALWMKGQNIQLKNLEGPEWSVPTASRYHPPFTLPFSFPEQLLPFIYLRIFAHTSMYNALGLRLPSFT